MDLFSLVAFFGGLGYFIFGMRTLTGGLSELGEGKTAGILTGMTKSPLRAGLFGITLTAAVQSSSAMTVLLIGMAEAGQVGLAEAGYILLGANIGTTVTPWLLSLAGIRGEASWTAILGPSAFAPLAAFAGVLLILGGKGRKRKALGAACCGFAVLMLGMERMQEAVRPLHTLPGFSNFVQLLSSPLLAAVLAALFTGIIQSSTASIGILQALAMAGGLNYGVILPVVMGQNVGTCITGLLSALGSGGAAKAVARFNLRINLIGAAVGVALQYLLRPWIGPLLERGATAAGIALCHSLFNVLSAVLLWPFVPRLCGADKSGTRRETRQIRHILP